MKLIFSKRPRKPKLKNRSMLLRAIRLALRQIRLPQALPNPEREQAVHVVLVGAEEIESLNRQYLGHEGATDVICFDLSDQGESFLLPGETEIVGEIYVCLPVAQEAAHKYSTDFGYEVLLYIVHGLLHLAGEDDLEPKARKRMRQEEQRVMSALLSEIDTSSLFD